MASSVNVHAAKTDFSALLARVEAGEEIVIARAGRPVARLVPLSEPPDRQPGLLRGRVKMAPDFDAPLSEELSKAFVSGAVEPERRKSRRR